MSISVCIPNYKRADDLNRCLQSIYEQELLPDEIFVHDDCSPNYEEIDKVVNHFQSLFAPQGINFHFARSTENRGYDSSLRYLINESESDYVLLIGNDDILLKNCIKTYNEIIENNKYNMYSRNFLRFSSVPSNIVGVSKFCKQDTLFSIKNADPKMAFRLCAFFGGLVFNREWAKSLDTSKWDGTLYYQYYLALHAFNESGIFCVSEPIISALADGIPLFADSDKTGVHISGKYSPKARAQMWANILDITKDFDYINNSKFLISIRSELKSRMSFHIMEMFSTAKHSTLVELSKELRALGVFWSPISVGLWTVNYCFGSNSRHLYIYLRKLIQSNKTTNKLSLN